MVQADEFRRSDDEGVVQPIARCGRPCQEREREPRFSRVMGQESRRSERRERRNRWAGGSFFSGPDVDLIKDGEDLERLTMHDRLVERGSVERRAPLPQPRRAGVVLCASSRERRRWLRFHGSGLQGDPNLSEPTVIRCCHCRAGLTPYRADGGAVWSARE